MGSALRHVLKEHDLICPKRHELNVANDEQVMKYANHNIDWIIHLASETDHEFCDVSPSHCYFVNTVGTGNMANLAKALGVPLIYVSTASVFDGKKLLPYTTADKPNPINHYNRSKYYGELIALEYERAYVLRAGWMFGGGPQIDKKFVNKIFQKVTKRGDKTIMVADDCVGSPTYSVDFAGNIKEIIEVRHEGDDDSDYGIYHSVNASERGVSRYEFALAIVRLMGWDHYIEIIPCKIDELKAEFPCKRTNYEVLDSSFRNREWKFSLERYLHANFKR